MNVGEMCNRHVVIARPDTSITEAAQLMREHHVGDLVIVEDLGNGNGHEPVAVVTDRDLVVEVLARGPSAIESSSVADAMTCELVTAREDEEISDVVNRMHAVGVRRMPVVDDRGTLQGIITYDDLVAWLAEQLTTLHNVADTQERLEGVRLSQDDPTH